MAKPIGYFNLSNDNLLVAEMTDAWGEDLAQMSENDCFWLIGRIAHVLWLSSDCSESVSENAEIVANRLHELEPWEEVALIRALIQEV